METPKPTRTRIREGRRGGRKPAPVETEPVPNDDTTEEER